MKPTTIQVQGDATMTGEPRGKTRFFAMCIAQAAQDSDVHVVPSRGPSFVVPRGTPWQEALPLVKSR